MNNGNVLNRMVLYAALVFAFSCSGAGHAKEVPNKESSEVLAEMKMNATTAKPYVAEYELNGPNGKLQAETGKGINHVFYERVLSKDREITLLLETWCADGERVFVRSANETVCLPDLIPFLESVAMLSSALSAEEKDTIDIFPSLYLEKETLTMGFSREPSGWIRQLESDDALKIEVAGMGQLEMVSNSLGKIVVDFASGSIIKQQNNGRTIERTKFEVEGAQDKAAEHAKSFQVGPYKTMSFAKAQPTMRASAFEICQHAVDAVEQKKMTIEKIKERMAKNSEGLASIMDKGFLDTKSCFLNDQKMDQYATRAYELTIREYQDKGFSANDVNEALKKLTPADMSSSIAPQIKAILDQGGREQFEAMVWDILRDNLKSTTREGRMAVEAIQDFLVDVYLQNAGVRAWQRLQRNKELD